MLFQIAVIFALALALYWLFEKLGLPGILGMLFGGALCNGSVGSLTFLAAFCPSTEPCLPKVYRRFQTVIDTVNEYLLMG